MSALNRSPHWIPAFAAAFAAFALFACNSSIAASTSPRPGTHEKSTAKPDVKHASSSASNKPGPAGGKSGPAVSEAELKEAKTLYGMRCAMCHGADGSGNGPAAAGLKPQPRDFRDPAWQASVTDDHIEAIIERGGLAVGKSALMPPNPDLAGKPVVHGLRAYIRSLRK